jgi:dipeptidyl aminopeptidase/acylaminoacyl peptidase
MIKRKSLVLFCFVLSSAVFLAGSELPITDWLVVKAEVFKPAFSDVASLFDFSVVDTKSLWPEEGQKLPWSAQQCLTWEKIQADDGKLNMSQLANSTLVLAATYLDVPRWMKAGLMIEGDVPIQVFCDGNLTGKGVKTELTLSRGKHRLLVAFIADKMQTGIEVALQVDDEHKGAIPVVSTDPIHNLSLAEALKFPVPFVVDMSSDGSRYAIMNGEGGVEIYSLPEGELLQTIFLPGRIISFTWSPDEHKLAVVTINDKGLCDIWLAYPDSGSTTKLYSGIQGISQMQWLPDGKFFAYATSEPPPEKGVYDLVDNFFDRWDGWKTKVNMWIASAEGGVQRMVSAGLSAYGFARQALLSPDGTKVVFVHSTPSSDYPYRHEELWLVDLPTGKAGLISEIKTSMISTMAWSPDSSQLAVIAPYYNYPKTPEDVDNYHSRWHQGIQLWDVAAKTSKYLTEPSFDPCVQSLWWNSPDSTLYFIALDRSVHRLYKFAPGTKEFSEVKLPFKNIEGLYGTKNSDRVILRVGEVGKPTWLVSMNLKTKENHKIWDKGSEFLSRARLGKYEMFHCENRHGTKLDGWIYFPPDFDPTKKYPTIISYYGGVVPQTQSFGGGQFGRINHWLAANGYVVFTVTPRGTWGYGQKFADDHFNEWGTVSAPDIIDAVKALIDSKPYVNADKIGGFGHSYGGFEGLSLATQTDLFATIIATGVISNTLNYSFIVLGQPNMGEIVLPGVYPWNRRDVYVDRSPVFNADKINTPILLMQGTDDPWCEMTESDQMYSALKVQGKDVVQIRWIGAGHGLRDFNSRLINENIRLEWFDKYLKNEPEGWEERYKQSRK